MLFRRNYTEPCWYIQEQESLKNIKGNYFLQWDIYRMNKKTLLSEFYLFFNSLLNVKKDGWQAFWEYIDRFVFFTSHTYRLRETHFLWARNEIHYSENWKSQPLRIGIFFTYSTVCEFEIFPSRSIRSLCHALYAIWTSKRYDFRLSSMRCTFIVEINNLIVVVSLVATIVISSGAILSGDVLPYLAMRVSTMGFRSICNGFQLLRVAPYCNSHFGQNAWLDTQFLGQKIHGLSFRRIRAVLATIVHILL